MVQAGWFIDSPWWWLVMAMPSLLFCLPAGLNAVPGFGRGAIWESGGRGAKGAKRPGGLLSLPSVRKEPRP